MSDVTIERDVMVEMRDGVALATDIYRPPESGAYPTLVYRIPYDKSFAWFVGSLILNPVNAVERGYAVVVQDTRGRFNSEGEWDPFHHEAADSYDTIEWAAEQEWSDGHVGIYGSSYMGVPTWQGAVADPPHLDAAFAYLTGSNYHEGWTYSGGAFELGFNLWWALFLGWDTLERLDISEDELEAAQVALSTAYANPQEAAEHLPLSDLPAFDRGVASYWEDWLEHPAYDDYWEGVDVNQQADEIDIPVLHVTGWFDNFLRGHLDIHETLNESVGGEVGENERFMIGPWDHEAYLSVTPTFSGDKPYGPQAFSGQLRMEELAFQWFGHHLKGEETGAGDLPGVQYMDLGTREWETTDTWPPAHDPTTYYLHSDGSANTRFGDGTLTRAEPDAEPADSFEYDPMDPVPSTGGRTLMPNIGPGGIADQADVEEREDVLVYTSPQLTAPQRIAGPVDVTLYAASSAPDTDFTAKLVDVEPDGYCANIAEGIQRGRYRNDSSEPEFLSPGEVHEFSIDLWSTAHTFEAGHRIRLEISSSNFPRYDRNLNVKTQPAQASADEAQVATQRVRHDDHYASSLTLPIVDE